MIGYAEYFRAVLTLIPAFSAIVCGALVAVSSRSSLSAGERRLKRLVVLYFTAVFGVWVTAFCYNYYPGAFVFLNVPCLVCFLAVPILFYLLIRRLINPAADRWAGWRHFIVPGVIAGLLFVWSFFVPAATQLEIIKGRGDVFPAGYEAYAGLFLSKTTLRGIFGMIYNVLTVLLLVGYYRKIKDSGNDTERLARWIVFLAGISVVLLFSTLVLLLQHRNTAYFSLWTVITVALILSQHILLTYHIIRRQYLPYTTYIIVGEDDGSDGEPPARRQHYGKITRQRLEGYFRRERPYLQQDFRITDLVDALDVNRTVISSFVNRTYGVNFSQYVNRWRLEELDRLLSLPSNEGKRPGQLLEKAGFGNSKHYQRAVAAERDNKRK